MIYGILALMTLIFIFSIISPAKEYLVIIRILISRFSDGDTIKIHGKTYNLSAQSKLFLVPILFLILCTVYDLFFIILAWTSETYRMESITFVCLLLPLNYSFTIGGVVNKALSKFISVHLSIEELKGFPDYKICQEKLRSLNQYLSADEAEELNQYYFDNKNIPRNFDKMFKEKIYQQEYDRRKEIKF